MGEPIRILHLSDFHFQEDTKWEAMEVLRSLNKSLAEFLAQGLRPDFVVLTGDIGWAGKKSDYGVAGTWVDDILLKALPGFRKEDLMMVPGNHDGDRSQVTDTVRDVENGLREGDEAKLARLLQSADSQLILRRHSEYLEFANRYRDVNDRSNHMWWCTKRKIRGLNIGFAGIASCLTAFGDDKNDYGKLLVGQYQLNEVFRPLEGTGVRVALMHHPLAYVVPSHQKAVKDQLLLKSSLVLRGHVHEAESMLHTTPDKDKQMLELATGSAFDGSSKKNQFQLIEIDLANRKIHVHYRIWKDSEWVVDRNAYKATPKGVAEFPLRLFGAPEAMTSVVSHPGKAEKMGKFQGNLWSRTLPKIPLTRRASKKLASLLEDIRAGAFRFLHELKPSLKDRQVRANVFLADYRDVQDGYAFTLYIPKEFRTNMNHRLEYEIRFLPGQGATGIAFMQGYPRYAKRLSKNEGNWESVFRLTTEQMQSVHKDLRWIYSFPLRDIFTSNTIGVLNIDGLDYSFNENVLTKMLASQIVNIHVFETYLSERPKVTLTIQYERKAK